MTTKNTSRRDFMKISLASVGALIFSSALFRPIEALAKGKKAEEKKEIPLPEGEKKLDENDPVAKALGFRHNVKDIDYAKYPQRKKPEAKNQNCKSCALYTAKNEGWGKCQMLANGLVSAEGWCGSWNKKA